MGFSYETKEILQIEESLKEEYKYPPQRKAVAVRLYRKKLEEIENHIQQNSRNVFIKRM